MTETSRPLFVDTPPHLVGLGTAVSANFGVFRTGPWPVFEDSVDNGLATLGSRFAAVENRGCLLVADHTTYGVTLVFVADKPTPAFVVVPRQMQDAMDDVEEALEAGKLSIGWPTTDDLANEINSKLTTALGSLRVAFNALLAQMRLSQHLPE